MPSKDFRVYLRQLLKSRGMNQREFAELLYMSSSNLSKKLASPDPLSPIELEQYRDKLALSADEIKRLSVLNERLPNFVCRDLPSDFVGRQQEVKSLLGKLKTASVVTICGAPGIGKTSLAIKIAHTIQQDPKRSSRYPDGIFFIELDLEKRVGNPEDLEGIALAQIAYLFGEEPKPSPLAAAQRILARKQALIILDGAQLLANVKTLISIRGKSALIITSRRLSDRESEVEFLEKLSEAEGVQLLKSAGRRWTSDVSALREIYHLVDGHPLALHLAGRYMSNRQQTAGEFLEILRESKLDALDGEKRQQEGIEVLLQQSFIGIKRDTQTALACASALAFHPFSANALAEALSISTTKVSLALGEAINESLMRRVEDRYMFSHSLIHEFSQKRQAVPTSVYTNLALFYIRFLQQYQDETTEGWRLFDREYQHLVVLLRSCFEFEIWESLLDMASILDPYLSGRGHWRLREEVARFAIHAAHILNKSHKKAEMLCVLGDVQNRLGHFDPAIESYSQALTIYEDLGEKFGLAQAKKGIALSLGFLGDFTASNNMLDESIRLFKEIYDKNPDVNVAENLAKALLNQGNIFADLGLRVEANERYQECLQIFKETGNRFHEAQALANIGLLHLDFNDLTVAKEALRTVLTLFAELEDKHSIGQTFLNLADVYIRQEKIKIALRLNRWAHLIFSEIGYQRGQSVALRGMGQIYHLNKDWDNALQAYRQSINIAQQTNSNHAEALALHGLANLQRDMARWSEALTNYTRAREILNAIPDFVNEGVLLYDLGLLYRRQGMNEEARRYWEKAISLVPTDSPQYIAYNEALDKVEAEDNQGNSRRIASGHKNSQ